ncbi:TPA: rRNA maturation RNase YbeY [Candidatus Nomurabacteria bacterium]|uniref:Endoribonuclease YbeY n=1 Tax=Candidatus Nomurabacteria bacterium GW2011_GWE1_35_16 TaxID=1618761 RepID=A0A0G0EF32_9BACT|nr:MAG: putative rRNA maturation factor [Candidatus Nomurabacteria bacterium GW2011_GWF1_34_20]KKP61749.1 MAG: putative rRNA maturation factor [Candidatus Nomurabacteria bacterium GW2011_GWE2_34_25]KKP65972.1 MAG: putative rRNA maturation factor [Candidatus Nomurabacteria bacterium GW2011_GWE1_35_16]HAE36819.1 rRNA maturation RNase YbeY [Candidatus Nomurabacteria bacterium]HAX65478.1 rRNA maturation RNase YbeY [Candidatus Nomurabacteria bacterium]
MPVSEFSTITNTTKGKLPRLPFVYIKNAILGEKYELGVSFLSSGKQRNLNKKYRGIDKTTNILSFPLTKTSGDITFDLIKVKKDAPLFDMTYSKFLKYLFIHGLLHLKGYDHSDIMEKQEKKFLKMFS